MFQAPSVMPFYAANTGPLPPQPGGMADPAGGFAPPLRDRFPNSVWHPASGADPNSVGMFITSCLHAHSQYDQGHSKQSTC